MILDYFTRFFWLELPAGASTAVDPSAGVAPCVEVAAGVEEEEEPAISEGAEPEVIGRKAEDEESESSS